MSKVSCYHADFSRKVKISKKRLFFKMAVTFDLNNIFKICFDFLKDNRNIFHINSGFFLIQIFNPKWGAKYFDDVIIKDAYGSKCLLT